MASLFLNINESADRAILIENNINYLVERWEISTPILNEAVTTWLAKIRNLVASGKEILPDQKEAYIRILGALQAISDTTVAPALDDDGDLGTVLYKAGGIDEEDSKINLARLIQIGRYPSLKSYVSNASRAIENAETIKAFTNKIATRIEPIMNKMLQQERLRAEKGDKKSEYPKFDF